MEYFVEMMDFIVLHIILIKYSKFSGCYEVYLKYNMDL